MTRTIADENRARANYRAAVANMDTRRRREDFAKANPRIIADRAAAAAILKTQREG